MIFRDILEVERSIRNLSAQLKDKPKGYMTEFKIKGQVFSGIPDQKIELILLDPRKNLVAYRPHSRGLSNNEKWLVGNYEKVVKDAFTWRNKIQPNKNETDNFQRPQEDTTYPEYTLMGFF